MRTPVTRTPHVAVYLACLLFCVWAWYVEARWIVSLFSDGEWVERLPSMFAASSGLLTFSLAFDVLWLAAFLLAFVAVWRWPVRIQRARVQVALLLGLTAMLGELLFLAVPSGAMLRLWRTHLIGFCGVGMLIGGSIAALLRQTPRP